MPLVDYRIAASVIDDGLSVERLVIPVVTLFIGQLILLPANVIRGQKLSKSRNCKQDDTDCDYCFQWLPP
jgi:hypothetical protein